MPFIRSVSGLRATVADSLSEEIVRSYALAFHKYLPKGIIVVGRDGRPSGEAIELKLLEALQEAGRDVVVCGIVPTPTVQILVEHLGAVGGIIITASHNPSEWNGLKFINSDGIFLDKNENESFWKELDDISIFEIYNGNIKYINNAIDIHLEKILSLPFISSNIEAIRQKKFKVGVDAVNASGSKAVPQLLKLLGCEVFPLYCDLSGEFPHTPEPLPINLTEIARFTGENNLDLGVAVDPDADRLVLIDERGININEELTVALAAMAVLSDAEKPEKAVVNLSSSRITKDIAEMYGCSLELAPVGEINVVLKMKQESAIIGGEGSGGVILPQCHYGRDSLVGIALIVYLLYIKDQSISQIVGGLPQYSMIKHKEDFSGDFHHIRNRLSENYKDYPINTEDGIRIDFDDSWVGVRTSNTEPIIRIIAESPSEFQTKKIIAEVLELLKK